MPSIIHLLIRYISLRACALCTFTEIPFPKHACSGISLSPLSDAVPARFRFASSRCGLAPYAPLQKSPFSSTLARGFLFLRCRTPCQLDSASLLLAAGLRPMHLYRNPLSQASLHGDFCKSAHGLLLTII